MSEVIGKQVTFAGLIEEFKSVQIPIIQRDYAQGRIGQEELRSEFLGSIKEALHQDGAEVRPLDLDFVYGSGLVDKDTDKLNGFAPLDGQQRLTTLFLLHWYLSWVDQQEEDFREKFFSDGKSLFDYEIRPSSHDFFNRMAECFPDVRPADVDSMADYIKDRSWFFRSWENDPTIQSALEMLNSIHEHFSDCEGFYSRITNKKQPRITFQLLELRHFGLSDDLYIKMNARGMPLTSFENFKARLEQHLDELLPNDTFKMDDGRTLSAKEYFSHQMDTKWTDLFWRHRDDPKSHLFDTKVMCVIKNVSLVSLDLELDNINSTVSTLNKLNPNSSFSRYDELGCLNETMLRTLIALLDHWSDHPELLTDEDNEQCVFNTYDAFKSSTSIRGNFTELTQFAALAWYVRQHGYSKPELLTQWLRVVHNLTVNSDVDRADRFIKALQSIDEFLDDAPRILEYLSEGGEVSYFYAQQVQEERVKAILISKGVRWSDPIYTAEKHEYLDGQIEFILDFTGVLEAWLESNALEWSKDKDSAYLERFVTYLEKTQATFGSQGLKNLDDYLWERALLCYGDYTLNYGKNCSFLKNQIQSGSNNQPAWKNLLRARGKSGGVPIREKRVYLKKVFDGIDLEIGVEDSLKQIIQAPEIDVGWRRMLVELPEAIEYCGKRMFRFNSDDTIFMISSIRTSSAHVELKSYYLYKTEVETLEKDGAFKPFYVRYANSNTDDYPPYILMNWHVKDVRVEIDLKDDTYRAALQHSESSVRRKLADFLDQDHKLNEFENWDIYNVPKERVLTVMKTLAKLAGEMDESS